MRTGWCRGGGRAFAWRPRAGGMQDTAAAPAPPQAAPPIPAVAFQSTRHEMHCVLPVPTTSLPAVHMEHTPLQVQGQGGSREWSSGRAEGGASRGLVIGCAARRSLHCPTPAAHAWLPQQPGIDLTEQHEGSQPPHSPCQTARRRLGSRHLGSQLRPTPRLLPPPPPPTPPPHPKHAYAAL